MRPFITAHQNLDVFYDIAGRVLRMRDARDGLHDAFDQSPSSPRTRSPEGARPGDRRMMEGLTDRERQSLRAPELATDRLRALDALPMGEFLRLRSGEDAAELVGAATGLEQDLRPHHRDAAAGPSPTRATGPARSSAGSTACRRR